MEDSQIRVDRSDSIGSLLAEGPFQTSEFYTDLAHPVDRSIIDC